MSLDTSRWNWTPYALSNRNAWFGYAGEPASRTAPGGRSKVSPCHCSAGTVGGNAEKTWSRLPSSVSSTGSTPTSGSAPA